MVVNQSAGAASKLIRYFSDWHRLWTAVAVFLRVLQIRCKERMIVKEEVSRNNNNLADQRKPSITKTVKRKDTEEPCSPLTVQDQVEAELAILKFDQDLAFGKEIPALQKLENENSLDKEKLQKRVKASTKNNSTIQRLDPFLENGILRVGGRLRRADLPHETKHPAILPWKSHVISNLREKYWIIKVNTAVRHVISKCVFCRRNYCRPGVQKMADLPKNRISPAPPFTHTGVDYFGLFIIKEGRKEVKRYGALFTCLVSRAVHIILRSQILSSQVYLFMYSGASWPAVVLSER